MRAPGQSHGLFEISRNTNGVSCILTLIIQSHPATFFPVINVELPGESSFVGYDIGFFDAITNILARAADN